VVIVLRYYTRATIPYSICSHIFYATGPRIGLSVKLTTPQSSSKEFPFIYPIGEVMFTARVTLPENIIEFPSEYLYIFSFGDGTEVHKTANTQELIVPHYYSDVCTMCVTEVCVIISPCNYYYYCNANHTISVLSKLGTCVHLCMYVHKIASLCQECNKLASYRTSL